MNIYRYNTDGVKVVVTSVDFDKQTELRQSIKGEDLIASRFTLPAPKIDLQIGDFIEFKETVYIIMEEPQVKKEKEYFQYNVEFKSDLYYLKNALVINPDTTELEFSLFGTAQDQVSLIINNLNRVYPSGAMYFADYIEVTEGKLVTYKEESCLAALQRLAQEFNCEFRVLGKQITFKKKIGAETNLTFRYKKELQKIERINVANSELVTRLYCFGSERNITNDYGHRRLRIDAIENNTEVFGTIEKAQVFEDIYPRHKGVVSTTGSIYTFTDTSIDFNLNDHLISGVTAQVVFNSGDLAGRRYDITSYDHNTKQVEIVPYKDESGLETPDSVFKPRVGDKYVFVGIKMPQAYIDEAEAELLERGLEYIGKYSLPNVIYKVQPHYPALRANTLDLKLGDIITVEDEDFGISFETRILKLRQKVSNEYEYQIEIGQHITINYLTKVIGDQRDIRNQIYFRDKYVNERFNRVYNGVNEFTQAVFINRGEFSHETYYYNNQNRIDFVYIINAEGAKEWYYFIGQDHSRGAWNLANWKFIGANFDIIATQTVLAENANIGNWIIQNEQLVSQSTGWENEPNAQLNGKDGWLKFISGINVETKSGQFKKYRQEVKLAGSADGLTATRQGDADQVASYVEFSSDGVRAEYAGQMLSYPPRGSSGRAAIAGVAEGMRSAANSWIAGVVGLCKNVSTTITKSPAFGGIFWKLKSFGRYVGVEKFTGTSFTCDEYTEYVFGYNTSSANVYLPSNPQFGHKIEVKRINALITVHGNGNRIFKAEPFNGTTIKDGDAWRFIWDGQYWMAQTLLR